MIEGLTGRDPIGAALTIGHKGPKGNPTDTDRFFIVVPQEENGVRVPHPAFVPFNNADPEKRRTLRCVLIHASQDQCFGYNLRAQLLPGRKGHPQKRPLCSSNDSKTAERWNGTAFDKIACPNDKCEFRKAVGDGPTPCKPFMRILFRPVWPEGNPLPTPLMKLTSGSWNTTAAFLGFFQYIAQQAAALGVPEYTLYGLPFVITLGKKKRSGDAASARSFPVLTVSPDVDLQRFLWSQQERFAKFGGPVAALTDREQSAAEIVDADYRSIVPGVSKDDGEVA